ncbi:MAG: FxsA cytoplasmic rane protein [Actinomycetota bacterium]|nr:FxsA cytoplasmic rane protein [Actinomycetota bacterium]
MTTPRLRPRLITTAVLALPLLELTLLLLAARSLGPLTVLLLLLAGAAAGLLVLRHVHSRSTRRTTTDHTVLTPDTPATTVLLGLAGILFLLPGFGSDLIALALLAPPLRRALSALAGETLQHHLTRHGNARVIPGTLIGEPRTDPPRTPGPANP